jgi:excisionase family DNA binding protein
MTTSPSTIATSLWTAAQAAAYLHVHVKTLYRWIRTRGLPCVYVGSRLRFDPRDVLQWVEARKGA